MTGSSAIIDFPSLAERLLADAPALLRQWLSIGKLRGREYVCGNLKGDAGDSLSINIDKGCWIDHATGESGGDLISLYAAIHNLKQSEAAKQLGGGTVAVEDVFVTGQECHPLPKHKHGKPTAVFEYRNAEGQLYGYVCRFDILNAGKQFAPLTCWQKEGGTYIWKWKKWPIDSLPYRIEQTVANPAAKILIVEGEGKAEYAQKLLPPDWIALGWCGGAEAVKRTNWQLLQTRYCWIWPDADAPGAKAAQALKRILPDLHIVDIPSITIDGQPLPEGWDLADTPAGFNVLEHLQPKSKPVQQLTMEEREVASEALQKRSVLAFVHVNNNKPLATIENLRVVLEHFRITCRYNVIAKRVLHVIPGEDFATENEEEAACACVFSRMKQLLMPTDGYKSYLLRIADENQYNPALEWVKSKPWDGKSRLQDLYDTIDSSENEAKELLIRRWLITAMYMASRGGIDAAGCLVLQGAQDLGKTWWVRRLVADGLRESLVRSMSGFDPHDKDKLKQLISYWIAELGDVGSTFNKADLDALKLFITDEKDILRLPYGFGEKSYKRRTAMIASVDQHTYLRDTAGNRRFWTIPCKSINSRHTIDMQQLWAEVLDLIEVKGETWQLEPDEKAHIARINQEHLQIDPIEELIAEYYRWDEIEFINHWKTATEIAREIGLKNVTQKETRIINAFTMKLNGGKNKRGKASNLLLIPALKSHY